MLRKHYNAARNVLNEGLRLLGGTEEVTRVEIGALANRLRPIGETPIVEARIAERI